MVTQGRTAKVEKGTIDGVSYFLKRNLDATVTDLEVRMYDALRADSGLAASGVHIPVTLAGPDACSFYVEDCGPTYSDHLHSGEGAVDFRDLSYVQHLVSVRRDVSSVVNSALTSSDREYLTARAQDQLRERTAQLIGYVVDDAELEKHKWAYRVMGALGITDVAFKELYTSTVGSLLDSGLAKYGTWLTDNCIRNNAMGRDGEMGVIPFDFNSLRYGLRQMDEGAVVGLSLFFDFVELDDVDKTKLLHSVCGTVDGGLDKEYYDLLMASMFHTNAMHAGYRTQDSRRLYAQLVDDISSGWIRTRDPEFLDQYVAFRTAFDEINLNSSIVSSIARGEFRSFGEGKGWDVNKVEQAITQATFGQRFPFICDPLYQEGEKRLFRSRDMK